MPEEKYPPLLADGFVDFGRLRQNHRRDYLDGWGKATVGIPSARPAEASAEFFNLGASEARAHTQLAPA